MSIAFSDWKVTPKHMLSDFTLPLNLRQKITIFFERTDGWQLNIADQIINGVIDRNGKIIDPSQSAYAVLHIVLSFFEMTAKYQDGYIGKSSKPYFKKGVKSLFPEIDAYPELLNMLYHGVRCGLYHCGYTDQRVFLVSDIKGAIAFTKQEKLLINTKILVQKLREYLKSYVEKLQNASNTQLRKNFEKRFDFDNALT